MEVVLLIICGFTLAYCMFAQRLSRTVLTAPMLFIGFGVALSYAGVVADEAAEEALRLVAEIALVILLFLDASQINIAQLKGNRHQAVRMLLIGLPLGVLFGTAAAFPFLEGWPLPAIALVAAILTPTDAALGQAVVTNKNVPEADRRTLTIESGLNDGLALPIILLFACMTAGAMEVPGSEGLSWLGFAALQLTLGPIAGIFVGYLGGRALVWAQDKELTSETFEGAAALALAGAAYLLATEIGGNGFIAAFVAGLGFGNVVKDKCHFIFEFAESEGQILVWGAFFLLGLALVPEAISELTPDMLAIILISLFLVRPLAIWISLIGSKAPALSRLFFGWFGPRGLATALFALLIVSEYDHEFARQILNLAVNAVWISALLHGLTAVPAAVRYGAHMSSRRAEQDLEKAAVGGLK